MAKAGTYTVSFRVAGNSAVSDAFHLANSAGQNLSGSIAVPLTGGWQIWTTVTGTVTLPAGTQVLTVDQDNGGGQWNMNWMSFAVPSTSGGGSGNWVTAWTEAPSIHVLGSGGENGLVFNQQTERNMVFSSVGGSAARVHLSNEYGTVPLVIGGVHVALTQGDSSTLVGGTDTALTFGGSPSVTIPVGGTVVSDPSNFTTPALAYVAVSVYFGANQQILNTTAHQFTEQTSYFASGNQTGNTTLSNASTTGNYYFFTGLDVQNSAAIGSVIVIGASITTGYASSQDANRRYTDILANRLNAAGIVLGVGNEGIIGNAITYDNGEYGVSILNRFNRDVINQAGIKYVLFSGDGTLNDIEPNPGVSLSLLEQDYQTMIAESHSHGIKFICSTLTPYADDSGQWTPQGEATREAINAWMFTSASQCDGVVDMATAVEDPSRPTFLLPAYASGIQEHPSDAGYLALGNSISLSLF